MIDAMVGHVLAPEHARPYLGPPPYDAFHPLGEPTSYCVVTGDPSDRDDHPLESPELLASVRQRISAVFELDYIEECVLARDEQDRPRGFHDEDGAPAIQVRVAVAFESPSLVWARFALNAGLWPGYQAWRCAVRQDDEGRWGLLEGRCAYSES